MIQVLNLINLLAIPNQEQLIGDGSKIKWYDYF